MATTSSYTFVQSDIPLLGTLFQLQSWMSPMQGSASPTVLDDLVQTANALCGADYPASGSVLQPWVDGFFTTLTTATTSSLPGGPYPVSMVYVAAAFSWFCGGAVNGLCSDFGFKAIDYNCCAEYFLGGPGSGLVQPWQAPTQPAAWAASVNTSVKSAINEGLWAGLANFPTFWTDYVNVPTSFTLWSQQSADLSGLLGLSSLADSQALFMLYVMVALTTSNANDQGLVEKIANTPVTSAELPNSNFAQHLAYFVPMYLADPTGWDWPPEQISTLFNLLAGAIPQSSATATLLAAFTSQQELFIDDPSYPMVDPNNAPIDFQTRYSDVLGAMNGAWPPVSSS